MKSWVSISLACFTGLLSLRMASCVWPVNCEWGPWSDWSECDGCKKIQTRTRVMAVYSQFGGNPCGGDFRQTQHCETARSCPLQEGCGDRFRCRSGKCISMSLRCNGDQDCEEDRLDELTCSGEAFPVCNAQEPPPNVEHLGRGYDAVTGKERGAVINTKSFGGQCSTTFSGDHKTLYRLPHSTLLYTFVVTVRNDFSDEMFSSRWSYSKDVVNRETSSGTTWGHKNYDLHIKEEKTKDKRLMLIKTKIEVAQFQSNAARHLPLSEEFWKALSQLPTVYDYGSYLTVLERFGTHYLTEGSLGGSLEAVVSIDKETEEKSKSEIYSMNECTKKTRYILFWPLHITKCKKDYYNRPTYYKNLIRPSYNNIAKMKIKGGTPGNIAALQGTTLDNPVVNAENLQNWGESVRTLPNVIESKMAPLSELLKEVPCAGMKKIHLARAIDQYLQERHTCRCRPCQNNGLVVMEGDTCKCICKPGTDGVACEVGAELEGQKGVIHGGWSCWSAWTSCSQGVRRRTRSCNNPAPQNAGQHCLGESAERGACDEDLDYLMSMEPHCFDQSKPARETCGTPPPLFNGFVLYPKDIYLVGGSIEYTCIPGYHLTGERMSQCQSDRTWTRPAKECKSTRCSFPPLTYDVTVSVQKTSYDIGQKLTLACPEGRSVLGEAEIICDASLHWSPNPERTRCSDAFLPPKKKDQSAQCERWEQLVEGKCVCIAPYQCPSSLAVCASMVERSRTDLMSVCRMHALQCRGMNMALAEDSACTWPDPATTPCSDCQLWETCNAQTNTCRCKDSTAECVEPGSYVCVKVGGGGTATMSECEAGLRKCKGEEMVVTGILPCAA